MKKIYSLLIVLAFCITACEKDTDDRLEGKWQLQQVETATGIIEVDTVYYNFQTSVYMYQLYEPATDTYRHCYGFKKLINNDLSLELNEYGQGGQEGLYKFIENYTDWDSDKRSFHVDEVNGSRLVLSSEGKTYTFRKF